MVLNTLTPDVGPVCLSTSHDGNCRSPVRLKTLMQPSLVPEPSFNTERYCLPFMPPIGFLTAPVQVFLEMSFSMVILVCLGLSRPSRTHYLSDCPRLTTVWPFSKSVICTSGARLGLTDTLNTSTIPNQQSCKREDERQNCDARQVCEASLCNEWEYSEGHKDLKKNIMMETRKLLTSLDGSPERCSNLLSSQDFPDDEDDGLQSLHIIIKEEIKNEEEEIPVCIEQDEATRDMDREEHLEDSRSSSDSQLSFTLNCKIEDDDFMQYSHSVLQDTDLSDQDECVDSNVETIHCGSNGGKMFPCTECDKCFTQHAALIRHQRSHTGEKPFPCSECGKSFTRKSILVEHMRIHTGEKPFLCGECGRRFTQKSSFAVHQRIHAKEESFICSYCGKGFTERLNSYTKGEEISCFYCREKATQKPESVEHGVSKKPFTCSECGRCFTNKSKLNTHEKIHNGEKPYSCSECKKSFSRKSILVEHHRIHTGEKPFTCSKCWKSFTQRSGLVMHQKVHTYEKTISCLDCGKQFMQASNCQEEEPMSCPECQESGIDGDSLDEPLKYHTGLEGLNCEKSNGSMNHKVPAREESFHCSQCEKSFMYRSELMKHEIIHTGEKPFSCFDCGKRFNQKTNLLHHLTIHTGEKPFQCSDCSKSFRLKASFLAHQRVHSGEKPYSCPDCGKCFTQKSNLLRHKVLHKLTADNV